MARNNREFVMLADDFIPTRHRSAGMYLSEKLDGMRCVWIPETAGKSITNFPFANRDKDRREHTCSGLWSRYGKIIYCPEWFVEDFPTYPLDGELFLGRGQFERVMSVCKKHEPDDNDWHEVKYKVFDAPRYKPLFDNGRINNKQWTKQFRLNDNLASIGVTDEHPYYNTTLNFDSIYKLLIRDLKPTDHMQLHEQELLPFHTGLALERIGERLEEVIALGGEGLILRHPSSTWVPQRSEFLMKVVKSYTAEGTIVGYKTGEEGKDGKFQGMLGSLLISWKDRVFNLSGCIETPQRALVPAASQWAYNNPGELLSLSDYPDPCPYFPHRSIITFKYKELTGDGLPRTAQFFRKYEA